MVEDFRNIRPFEQVSNHPILIVLSNGRRPNYPLPYRVWHLPSTKRRPPIQSTADFYDVARTTELLAMPLPGDDGGPWIRGAAQSLPLWTRILKGLERPAYRARKGVCTDRNGIFFLSVKPGHNPGSCLVSNDPGLGRTRGLLHLTDFPTEVDHLYPLLRGEGVGRLTANVDLTTACCCPRKACTETPICPSLTQTPSSIWSSSRRNFRAVPATVGTSVVNRAGPCGTSDPTLGLLGRLSGRR